MTIVPLYEWSALSQTGLGVIVQRHVSCRYSNDSDVRHFYLCLENSENRNCHIMCPHRNEILFYAYA